METRPLGLLEASVVGLGCNNFGMTIDAKQTKLVVDAAIDAGINYFDTAESYGKGMSEEYLGKALGSRRGEVLVASKWGHDVSLAEGERGGDPVQIRARLEASLTRLGTDYIDHYQLHRPDPETPAAETLGCLAELVAEGKIREIGCTHFTADELDDASAAAIANDLAPYPSVQNHYSLLTRGPEKDGVFDACERHGIAFVPYFPLESGLLTGKYRLGEERPANSRLVTWGDRADAFIDDDKLRVVARLTEWAASKGHTLLDLAMSWHTSHPQVASVIAGATKPEQIHANVAASGWKLTAADRAEVDAVMAL
ncbi:MAG: aryl-alcohol dehydrogenase-like predicted oxidoreductase [Acidimicrobiales bacterium]|jgi:aryl-alcohol dehydrogenase-like predicted oxidoreductase